MSSNTEVNEMRISVTSKGVVSKHDKDYAEAKIRRLVTQAGVPVRFSEVKLTQEPDPARQRPSIAEGVLDVNGESVRAHVAAHEMGAAIDLLEGPLRRRLERHAHISRDRHDRILSRDEPEAEGWRHGDLTANRPEYFPRPVDERELVRRKSFATSEMTPDEAVDAMDLLGHDFFLFTNIVTGSDAVVSYRADSGLELIDASDRDDALGADTVAPVELRNVVACRMSTDEAIEQLDLDLDRFVFFLDADDGRGRVVYHRYDGHYGLISPP